MRLVAEFRRLGAGGVDWGAACAQQCSENGAERLAMTFTRRLRDGVRRGEITCSVRIWTRPHVKVGGRYRMEEGEIEVDSIEPIGLPDITPQLARASGFPGVVDLLRIANHGKGRNIYLVRFHYLGRRSEHQRDRQAETTNNDQNAGIVIL
jgi:hypothetical protein